MADVLPAQMLAQTPLGAKGERVVVLLKQVDSKRARCNNVVARLLPRRGVMRRTVLLTVVLPVAALALAQPLGASQTPWQKLHRPLHLPRLAPGGACPVSQVDRRIDWERVGIFGGSGIGRGPVYPGLGGSGGHLDATPEDQYGGPWAGGKVFWYVRPSYRGRVLIRGRRLDGPQSLGFNGSVVPKPELRIHNYSVSWEGQPTGSRGIPSSVRVRSSGCYGVQIDGGTFSRIVVFTVTAP